MELPTTPTKPTTQSPKTLVIYGPPKVGKTTILSKLPNCLIVDCEAGTDYVEAMKINITKFTDLVELGKSITAAGNPYSYVAIDTIDVIEQWCESRATTLYKNSPQGKSFNEKSVLTLPMGAGYLWLRTAFHEAMDIIKKLAPRIILVSHLRDKFLDNSKEGKEVQAKDLDLTGKIRSIVCSYADAIGYMYRESGALNKDLRGHLMMTFQTTDAVTCGARNQHLKNKVLDFTYPDATADDWKKIYID